MNHHSIAIIRKKVGFEQNEHSQFSYLVLKDVSDQYFFFETISLAIGGRFDFTSFKKAIYKYFELDGTTGTYSTTEFQTPPLPFKHSKRDPLATAYIYEFSEEQIGIVNERINFGSAKWSQIKWLDESELKSLSWKADQNFLFINEEPFKQPAFTNEFRADLTKIVEAKNNGKLVIFVGAGISYDSNVPGWKQLVDELKADLTTSETDFLNIAQLYYDTRGHKEYYDKISDILKFGKTTYNAVHKKITELAPVHIVTTNYDTHFEQLIEQRALSYSIIRTDADLPFAKGNSLYVKMHGDLGIKRVVLKRSDYDGYSEDFPLMESFIKEIFASKLVLFLGFSFEDTNLQKILEIVQKILKSNIQKPYMFVDSISNESKKEKWSLTEKAGVNIITYNSALKDYFNQVCLEEDSENLKKIKRQSQEVYTFLRVIEEFDPASDGIENLEIPKQLTHSILRFDGLGAIPFQILKRIAPFKLKKQPKYDTSSYAEYNPYQPLHLQTANEELLKFLKEKKGGRDNIEYSISLDPNLSADDQNLHRVFKTLDNSGVECIIRKNDTTTEHFKLKGINGKPKCNCLRCLARNLQFKELIQTLHSSQVKAICEGDQMNERLLESHAYYKTGQFVKCYYALEAARNKTLKEQNYISYFIASYNQTKLLTRLKHHDEPGIKQNQIESIIQKIERLDIYDLLTKLPVENIVRECLQYILEDRIYKDTLPELQDEFEQIKENYKKFKKQGYNVYGPVIWNIIQVRFYLIYNFYNQNFLLNDDDYDFWVISELYIESMLCSYATSNRYASKLNKMPPFFNQISVHYGYPRRLNTLFKKYKIDFIDQLEPGQSPLLEFNSFLESTYDLNSFNNASRKNILFASLVDSSYSFESKVVRLFNNQLVVLQHIRLTKEEINTTIDKVVNFLSVSDAFGFVNSFNYLSDFLTKYIKEIDEEHIHKIVKFSLSDHIWPDGLIRSFCNALISLDKRDFLNDEIIQRIKKRVDNRSEWPMKVNGAFPLFPFFKPTQKEEFLKFTHEQFKDATISNEIIKYGYGCELWNPIINRNIFEQFFNSVISQSLNFPEYKITQKGRPLGNNFQPWNDFYFMVKLLYKYNLLDSEIANKLYDSINMPLLKWILKPRQFKYSQFKLKWALVFVNPEILKVTRDVPELTETLQRKLRVQFNSEIARLYLGPNP